MSRRLHRPSRRIAQRAATFDPLADPDLVGLWLPSSASDDGSTLTVPNSVSGGADATVTNAGRPTIDATGLGGQPGIDCEGASAALSAAISLSGVTELTVYVVALAQSTTAGYFWRYGAGNQAAWAIHNTTSDGNVQIRKADNLGTETFNVDGMEDLLWYPRVLAFLFDITATADEISDPYIDGHETPGSSSAPLDTDGSFGTGPFYIGNHSTGASPFPGIIGATAVIARKHTPAEVAKWTRYLRQLSRTTGAKEVMWMGDSITACSAVGSAQWRKRIQDNIDGAGETWYRAIGELHSAATSFTHERSFSAGGRTIADLVAYIATFKIGTVYVPDVIPILIGTNDIAAGTSNVDIATAYGGLLDDLSAACPNALIIAQKLMPRTDNPTYAAQVTDWNDNFHATMVADAQGRGVNVISDNTLATLAGVTYLPDDLHPAAASENDMGDAMEAALRTWAGIT